jgi:hypothetical protein
MKVLYAWPKQEQATTIESKSSFYWSTNKSVSLINFQRTIVGKAVPYVPKSGVFQVFFPG